MRAGACLLLVLAAPGLAQTQTEPPPAEEAAEPEQPVEAEEETPEVEEEAAAAGPAFPGSQREQAAYPDATVPAHPTDISRTPCMRPYAPRKPFAVGDQCLGLTADLRADHRIRSTRDIIIAETARDDLGPDLFISPGELAPNRSKDRTLFEGRLFLNHIRGTEMGDFFASLGVKGQIETPPRRRGDPNNDFFRTGRRVLLERASLSLGGLTAGYAPSAFTFTPSLSYTTAYASEINTTLVSYTAALGNDLDLTLSLEDAEPRRIVDEAWGRYRQKTSIDPVATLRKRLEWGTLQLAGALHPVRAESSLDCCAPARGEEMGWAVLGGVEGWFETGIGSTEILFNLGASKGALGYINASEFPADFALFPDGDVRLTDGQAVVASAANSWTRQLRTVLTLSAYRTDLDTDRFRWKTDGYLAQTAVEFTPIPLLVVGAELSYQKDRARITRDDVRDRETNDFFSVVFFLRKRFHFDLGRLL